MPLPSTSDTDNFKTLEPNSFLISELAGLLHTDLMLYISRINGRPNCINHSFNSYIHDRQRDKAIYENYITNNSFLQFTKITMTYFKSFSILLALMASLPLQLQATPIPREGAMSPDASQNHASAAPGISGASVRYYLYLSLSMGTHFLSYICLRSCLQAYSTYYHTSLCSLLVTSFTPASGMYRYVYMHACISSQIWAPTTNVV